MPPRGPTYKTLEKDIRRLYSEQYNLHPEMNRLRTELKRRRGTKEWKDHLKEWGPYYDMLNEQLGANPKQW